MDAARFTAFEFGGAIILTALLVAAIFHPTRHYRTPIPKRTRFHNFIVPLIGGLAMLDFLLINMLGEDLLDPDRTLTIQVLITVYLINLPLAILTTWASLKPYRK